MKLEINTRRAFIACGLLLLFFIPNILAQIFFPYEVLTSEIVDYESNYKMTQGVMFLTFFPLTALIFYVGYITGAGKYEKSV